MNMSLPGAHIASCLEDLEVKVELCRAEARKQSTLADAYEESARKLRRAIRDEAAKLSTKATGDNDGK